MKKKILISTDSGNIHTGLAEMTRLLFTRLLKKYPDEYDIHQLGWFHANPSEPVSWKIVNTNVIAKDGKPTLDPHDRYGQKSFESVLDKVKPDIVWSSGDLWCFDHLLNSPNRNSFRLVTYYTIDGQPYWGSRIEPGQSSEWGNKLAKADHIVVWSEWGVDVLKKSCPELKDTKIDFIYHPVDLARFEVMSQEKKVETRTQLYNPTIPRDAFVMGWVGRNQFRKQNHKLWEVLYYLVSGNYIKCNDCRRITVKEYDHAARRLREVDDLMKYEPGYDYSECWYCRSSAINTGKTHDDIYLWLHMNKTDPGWNPDLHSKMWQVDDKCIYTAGLQPSKGLPSQVLAKLMSSWDAMLYLSGGEGFGIPAMESMACGVPVVYTNYSSHRDFCKFGGLPVRIDYMPELAFAIHRAIADTGDAVKQVLALYEDKELRAKLGADGRQHAGQYTVDTIAGEWHKIFCDVMVEPVPAHSTTRLYAQSV